MCRALLLTIGALMVLFGISGLWMMPSLVQQKIEQRLQLKMDTKTFDRFTKVPIPLTVKFYLFNITNSEQVLLGLERPRFLEVGPFVYKQWRRRQIVDFADYNRKLVYKEFKTFYQVPLEGAEAERLGALDPRQVNITMVNLPLLSVLSQLAKMEEGSLKRQVAARVAGRLIADGRDQILTSRPANQILFDGYKVDFMESARDLLSGTFGFNFESPLPRNMFGFFYNKNNTWSRRENGELTIWTGRNGSMEHFMQVDAWNEQRQLNVWPTNTEAGNRCNQIRGTDGSQFQPGVTRHQLLSIFSPLVCTSLQIRYKEDTQARDIPLLRFITSPELFAAPRKTPKNACYCTIPSPKAAGEQQAMQQQQQVVAVKAKSPKQITDARCYLDGLMDLSLCQRGAPVAASSPHFYNADPMLAAAAGLQPNRSLHETYLDIEPMTGAVMRAASRAQLNALVEPAALEVLEAGVVGHMAPMVAPLLWLEEAAEIDEKSANEFKGQLLAVLLKARRSFLAAILLGCLLLVAVGAQYWYLFCYQLERPAASKPLELDGSCSDSDSAASFSCQLSARAARGRQQRRRRPTLGGGARHSNLAAAKQERRLLEAAGPLAGTSAADRPAERGSCD